MLSSSYKVSPLGNGNTIYRFLSFIIHSHTPSRFEERTFVHPRRLRLRAPDSVSRARATKVFRFGAQKQTSNSTVDGRPNNKIVWRLPDKSRDKLALSFRSYQHLGRGCSRPRADQRHGPCHIDRRECLGCSRWVCTRLVCRLDICRKFRSVSVPVDFHPSFPAIVRKCVPTILLHYLAEADSTLDW